MYELRYSMSTYADHSIFAIYFKVASKGAGLNPNAKVWQEIPQGNTEVSQAVNGTEDSWDEASTAAESHAEGMFVRMRSCSLPTKCVATYLWHIVLILHMSSSTYVFITRGNIKIKPWPFKTIWSYMRFFFRCVFNYTRSPK